MGNTSLLTKNMPLSKVNTGRAQPLTELRHSLAAEPLVTDYTPSKDTYKKSIDLKELESAAKQSNLVKFGG